MSGFGTRNMVTRLLPWREYCKEYLLCAIADGRHSNRRNCISTLGLSNIRAK